MSKDQEVKRLKEELERLSGSLKEQQEQLRQLRSGLATLEGKEMDDEEESAIATKGGIETFIGLRLMHIIGIVVLVIGLSIGVKYAVDRKLISELTRIILAYTAGAVLLTLSILLRKKYALFSAILFSGAMASLYFTTYAAFVYYYLFSFTVTFIIMVAITIYTTWSAIDYNRQEIGILGMVGAYGIPLLISANSEKVELFFSYIIFIDIAIVILSFKKNWKWMGQLAMMVSWTLFLFWLYERYWKTEFNVAMIVMISLYALFLINAITTRLAHSLMFTLGDIQRIIVNNIALYVSTIMIFTYDDVHIQRIERVTSVTGFMTVFLIILALAAVWRFPWEKILQKALSIQAIVMMVLYTAFQWDGLVVTLIWASIGTLLFAWGIYWQRPWPRLSAVILMALTLGKLILFDSATFTTEQKIIAYILLGTLLLVLSFLYQKFRKRLFR